MKKIKVYFIQLIWSSLINENEPTITADEQEAFMSFSGIATSCGFRKPKSKETFEEYRADFFDFEFRYRNENKSILVKDRKKQITTPRDWNPDDNEILYHEKEIEIPI